MGAFWARGYEATSMSDLVDIMGINRGSIYTAFDSKHALFMEALRHYDDVHRRQFLARIARDFSGKAAIFAVFEAAAGNATVKDNPGGCLIVNSALEMAPHDADVRQLVEASFLEIEDFFVTSIEEARTAGDVGPSIDSRETAQALLGLFLGLRVLARSAIRRITIDGVLKSARGLLA
jgi:TetR/AcrR family transcriptional repressor of nem operon